MIEIKIVDWFSRFFRGKTGTINIATYQEANNSIALEAFALYSVIDMIASLLSKCEFRTYAENKEIKGLEWVSLNVSPNRNQNATEFWQELYRKLLYQREIIIVDINGEKIIPDSYSKQEYAILDTRFTDVTRKDFTFNKTFDERNVYHFTYSNIDAQVFIDSIFQMYQNLITLASGKYERSGGEKGILSVSAQAQGDPNFEDNFKNLMNNHFKAYFENKNAVLPLWSGYDYKTSTSDSAKKYSNEISDIKTLVDEALARASQAYRVPPALIRGDVAGIKDAYDVLLTNCIDPLAKMISQELTRKQFTKEQIADGYSIELDTRCIKHIDIFDISASADKLIASSVYNTNEIRRVIGDKTIDEEWANQYARTKNYETIEALKGGENNEEMGNQTES